MPSVSREAKADSSATHFKVEASVEEVARSVIQKLSRVEVLVHYDKVGIPDLA